MPRPPRVHYPGALFHIVARGNGGQQLFFTDKDYEKFLEIISIVMAETPFRLYAFCLMPNHVHLLMEVDQFPTWVIMQRIQLRYSKYFNISRKRFGHVFQARYKPILCEKDSYLLKLIQYIHLNPVGCLVDRPEDWRWSSHNAYLNPYKDSLVSPAFPLSLFGPDPLRARERYLRFIHAGIGKIDEKEFRTRTAVPCLGDPEFVARFVELSRRPKFSPMPLITPRTLREVAEQVAAETGIPVIEIRTRNKRPRTMLAKRRIATMAVKAGCKAVEVAAFLNCSSVAISRLLQSR